MLRSVDLPDGISGKLYLHSMPGRYEPFDQAVAAIRLRGISQVICLVSSDEIDAKSPDYARLLRSNHLPWRQEMFPIVDFGVPRDRMAFFSLAERTASSLRGGANILVHCGAGVGRTGLLAASVLILFGLPLAEAVRRVEAAGSHAERPEQVELLEWVAQRAAGVQAIDAGG